MTTPPDEMKALTQGLMIVAAAANRQLGMSRKAVVETEGGKGADQATYRARYIAVAHEVLTGIGITRSSSVRSRYCPRRSSDHLGSVQRNRFACPRPALAREG